MSRDMGDLCNKIPDRLRRSRVFLVFIPPLHKQKQIISRSAKVGLYGAKKTLLIRRYLQ